METDCNMNNFLMKQISCGKCVPKQTFASIATAVANLFVRGRKKNFWFNSHRPGSQSFTGLTFAVAK